MVRFQTPIVHSWTCTAAWVLLGLTTVAFALSGCKTRTFSNLDRYADYVTASTGPFVETQVHENVEVEARFAPPEAMALSALRRIESDYETIREASALADSTRRMRIEELRQKANNRRDVFRESLYFYLTIEPTEGDLVYNSLHRQGYNAYKKWLHRLLFGLHSKISLRTEEIDEIPLSVYRMDRSYGMSRHRTFLLAFPAAIGDSDLRNGSVELVVEEFGLRTGRLVFDFDIRDLLQRATLDLGLEQHTR